MWKPPRWAFLNNVSRSSSSSIQGRSCLPLRSFSFQPSSYTYLFTSFNFFLLKTSPTFLELKFCLAGSSTQCHSTHHAHPLRHRTFVIFERSTCFNASDMLKCQIGWRPVFTNTILHRKACYPDNVGQSILTPRPEWVTHFRKEFPLEVV